MSSYFTEKLVQEIQSRPCIWDTADADHLKREVLSDTWADVARRMYTEWQSLGTVERRDRVVDLKKKWTNVKDSFVKDVKGRKPRKSQHAPPEPREKYYLFDRLQFLLPVVRDAMRRADDDGRPEKKRRKTGGRPRPKRRDAPRSDDAQRHVDAAFDRADDDDLSFMVSLMPSVGSMDEAQKIDFRIGVLRLVATIKFDGAQPAAVSSSTRRGRRSRRSRGVLPAAPRRGDDAPTLRPTIKEEEEETSSSDTSPGTLFHGDTDEDCSDDGGCRCSGE